MISAWWLLLALPLFWYTFKFGFYLGEFHYSKTKAMDFYRKLRQLLICNQITLARKLLDTVITDKPQTS